MKRFRIWLLLGLAALFGPVMAGCSGDPDPDLNSVTGTVTLDGQPLAGATVTFVPLPSGRPASATTDENGRYELIYSSSGMGAPDGKYLVTISNAKTITDADGNDVDVENSLPLRYHAEAADNPEMNVEVGPDSTTFDFNLTSQGKKPAAVKRTKRRRTVDSC